MPFDWRQIASVSLSAALHSALFVALLTLSTSPVPVLSAPKHSIDTFVVPPPEHPVFDGLTADDPVLDLSPLFDPNDRPRLTIDAFSIELNRIAEHARVLFPFVTPGLALEYFEPSDHRLQFLQPRESMSNQERASAERLPLEISESTLQSYVDRAWSRQGRWKPFQRLV